LPTGCRWAWGTNVGIRARESALERQGRPQEEAQSARHGLATFLAFIVAGFVPLVPYLVPGAGDEFIPAACLAFGALFGVGAARSLVTASRYEAPRESPGRHPYARSSLCCALIRRARGLRWTGR